MGSSVTRDKLSPIIKRLDSHVSEAGTGRAGDVQRTREQPPECPDHTPLEQDLGGKTCEMVVDVAGERG